MYAVMVNMALEHSDWMSFVFDDDGEDVYVTKDYETAVRYAEEMTHKNLCPYTVVQCIEKFTTEVDYG